MWEGLYLWSEPHGVAMRQYLCSGIKEAIAGRTAGLHGGTAAARVGTDPLQASSPRAPPVGVHYQLPTSQEHFKDWMRGWAWMWTRKEKEGRYCNHHPILTDKDDEAGSGEAHPSSHSSWVGCHNSTPGCLAPKPGLWGHCLSRTRDPTQAGTPSSALSTRFLVLREICQ